MNLNDLTDDDLDALRIEVLIEQERRAVIETAAQQAEALNARYTEAIGREDGDAWVQPSGYHDAYSLGAIVTHNGKTWRALRNGASGEPGIVTGDWQEHQEEGQIVDWVQPHAGAEYPIGALVRHNGHTWRNDHTGPNGWMPGTPHSGWTQLD